MPRKQRFKPSRKPKSSQVVSEPAVESRRPQRAAYGSREVEREVRRRADVESSDSRVHDAERAIPERIERTAIEDDLEQVAPSNRDWKVNSDDIER